MCGRCLGFSGCLLSTSIARSSSINKPCLLGTLSVMMFDPLTHRLLLFLWAGGRRNNLLLLIHLRLPPPHLSSLVQYLLSSLPSQRHLHSCLLHNYLVLSRSANQLSAINLVLLIPLSSPRAKKKKNPFDFKVPVGFGFCLLVVVFVHVIEKGDVGSWLVI